MRDTSKVLGALLLGAAAGAALGLLLAPEKGTDMRKKIKEAGEDLLDELNDKIAESKQALSDLKDKAMTKASDLKETAKEKAMVKAEEYGINTDHTDTYRPHKIKTNNGTL